MSRALNLVTNNIQGNVSSEISSLPFWGVSGRAVSISPCPRQSECNTIQLKIMSSKYSLRRLSFVCNSSSGSQRRSSDFSSQNRHRFSRSRNRLNEERDNSENLDESEFLSTNNGPLLSFSNSPKTQATAAPGPREREIVELFRKVQAKLRKRAAVKEEKKFEAPKGQNKESETVDSLLRLLRKHSVEQGKRKVNGGSAKEFNIDRPRPNGQADEDMSSSILNSNSTVGEETREINTPSFRRPVSNFRRRSPVLRVRYQPIVSPEDTYSSVTHSDQDGQTSEAHSEPDPEPEPESDLEPNMDLVSGLELDQKEERVGQPTTQLEPETEFVDGHGAGQLSEAEFSYAEEDDDDNVTEKNHSQLTDLSAMKLAELRALAKARGMKGYSKLKKSELVGLLSEDSL